MVLLGVSVRRCQHSDCWGCLQLGQRENQAWANRGFPRRNICCCLGCLPTSLAAHSDRRPLVEKVRLAGGDPWLPAEQVPSDLLAKFELKRAKKREQKLARAVAEMNVARAMADVPPHPAALTEAA